MGTDPGGFGGGKFGIGAGGGIVWAVAVWARITIERMAIGRREKSCVDVFIWMEIRTEPSCLLR